MTFDFDRTVVSQTAHRPWPMPVGPWLMTQTWRDLLFAHWPVEPAELRARVPPAFELDTFDGVAWIGVVPFLMSNVGPRGFPPLPWVSEFPELNVRTYVRVGDRPGVYFFSLDAASVVAVKTARLLLNLPYFSARMSIVSQGRDSIEYDSRRRGSGRAAFRARYGPTGLSFEAAPGTLEYFLTERYCLYNLSHRGRPQRVEIHHPAWALQPADASISVNTMAEAAGLSLPRRDALLHFSKRQDTVAWAPTILRGT